jgi:hypothetical protein
VFTKPSKNLPDFCVSKYEMKEDDKNTAEAVPEGSPWIDISTSDASDACQRMGVNYRLMTNTDWMVAARNIELSRDNWSSGRIRVGSLSHGHSDKQPAEMLAATVDDNDGCYLTEESCSGSQWNAQRRTNTLLSGDTVWDFAGNSHEVVDWVVTDGKASALGAQMSSWQDLGAEFSVSSNMKLRMFKPLGSGLSTIENGIGGYFPGEQGSGGFAQRGGSFGDGINSGIYALALDADAGQAHSVTSFRCAWQPDQ